MQFLGEDWRPQGLIESRVVASSAHAKCEVHTIRTEKGQLKKNWIWLDEVSHVCILVHLKMEGKYLLFYQTKYALSGKSYAPIGGYFNRGESAEECARRELLEEVGLESENLINMGQYRSKGNRGGGMAHFFVARNCVKSNKTRAISDDSEYQEIHLFTLKELISLLIEGKVLVGQWMGALALGALRELYP